MLNQQDILDFPEAMVPAGGPVEPVLIKFQTLLANALAMLQLVHLTVVKRFHFKFNELALASPYHSSLRSWQLTKLSGQQWPVRSLRWLIAPRHAVGAPAQAESGSTSGDTQKD